MQALLLFVGLYRAPYALDQTTKSLLNANPTIQWDTILVTDQVPYCEHADMTLLIVNTSSFLKRLSYAYEHIELRKYDLTVVLRPDVTFTRALHVVPLCTQEKTTYIISGSFTRPYIFHNRDWDFGYVACDATLFRFVAMNNVTKGHIPPLPKGFRGCWGDTCANKWRYPYMENVIARHMDNGVTLRNLDTSRTFLALHRGKTCGSYNRRGPGP